MKPSDESLANAVPSGLELVDGIGVFRPVSDCSLQVAVARVAAAFVEARLRGIDRLLVDIRGFTGFGPPTLSERHWMVRQFATAGEGRVRSVMLARPEYLDPERFGVIAAANVGMVTNSFSDEVEAMNWLRQLPDWSK